MPCRDEGAEAHEQLLRHREHVKEFGSGCSCKCEEMQKLQERCDLVTRLLCAFCGLLEIMKTGKLIIAKVENGELAAWWENHKKIDAAREKREAAEKARKEK